MRRFALFVFCLSALFSASLKAENPLHLLADDSPAIAWDLAMIAGDVDKALAPPAPKVDVSKLPVFEIPASFTGRRLPTGSVELAACQCEGSSCSAGQCAANHCANGQCHAPPSQRRRQDCADGDCAGQAHSRRRSEYQQGACSSGACGGSGRRGPFGRRRR